VKTVSFGFADFPEQEGRKPAASAADEVAMKWRRFMMAIGLRDV
jgi:hypothetical protein